MYKCKECDSITTLDYFAKDGETCLDCADYDMEMAWQKYEQANDEGTLDLYRDSDTMVGGDE